MKKILVNSANLHSGGGVQVAISFITELSKERIDFADIDVVASSRIDQELKNNNVDTSNFNAYFVKDFKGLKAITSGIDALFDDYDLIFTVFGPSYSLVKNQIRITGFAQPWILYPDNELYREMSLSNRLVTKLKFQIQKLFFYRDDLLVVEQESVKNRLIERGCEPDYVEVAHNAVSNIFHECDRWEEISTDWVDPNAYKLGIISRDYTHKNLGILVAVKRILESEFNTKIQFVVTFREDEWRERDKAFQLSVTNVGELTSAQCPAFYNAIDGVIFPSLLEAFSITPFEAMLMRKPLFASDRDFIRTICSEYAVYFDPLDAQSVASSIFDNIQLMNGDGIKRLEDAREHVLGFSDPQARAKRYIELIEAALGSS